MLTKLGGGGGDIIDPKKIAGQVMACNSKNFHTLNRKIDQVWTKNGLEEIIRTKPTNVERIALK